ncbi:L,D-transpeptidase family protein [Paenibacillus sabinae]|uniref:ErfK/YbiS/YcfS/YnhG family protein n=1 Tax=Paenibacillus sabinae T27 TaxID=1268072 RepID=X4Z8I3_9BACL|nr:L,D-transpeptidase family protein [Paenibacillus sabinae]AHV96016.1 ErfK/YbiS/YcfS/YnhG family protein [Paenibacillus sabinae T27]
MYFKRGEISRGTVVRRAFGLMLVFVLLLTGLFAGEAGAAGTQLIVVNKKINKLAFFDGGKLVREFPVATGREKSLTPEGSFKLVSKIKNRPYYKEHIPGGDPANPLGDRWLGLDVNGTRGTTYAIHGNNRESSIGKYVSAGCIRMHNADIHWLFPLVQRNTTVVITSTTLGMESIARKYGYILGTNTFAGTIAVNGVATKLSQPFILENSRVYVPLRETATVLGAKLGLDAEGALTITKGTRTASHKPLTDYAIVGGTKAAMLASRNENGTLMIPLSSVPLLFGVQIQWTGSSGTVTIL